MGKRRSSRELTLKFLYQSEMNKENIEEQLKIFIERNSSHGDVEGFMESLVKSIYKEMKETAPPPPSFSFPPPLPRLPVIDRNILRMGTCELLFDFLTPPRVVINEAIDIAKKYGNEDSPEFINGILDKIHKKIGHKGILPLPI